MDKKEFPGKLQRVSSEDLINRDKNEEIQSFFLILGLIFNDLKGLVFFQKFIEDNYRKPDPTEVSAHAGEYNGLMAQANKLLIATVGEFFIFLEKNEAILKNIYFLLLLKKLNPETRSNWIDLTRLSDGSSILSKIARVRSNVAFHYDHSMEELRKGYIRSFFSERKDLVQHKYAYFSIGMTMEQTRMYYSDAAAEDYILSLLGTDDKLNIRKAIDQMNHTIRGLLHAHLEFVKKH